MVVGFHHKGKQHDCLGTPKSDKQEGAADHIWYVGHFGYKVLNRKGGPWHPLLKSTPTHPEKTWVKVRRCNTGAAGLKRNGPVVAQWNKSQGSGRSRQGSDWPKLAMQNNARWRCTRGWWWDSIIKGSNTTAVWPFAIKGDLFDLSKVFDHFIWDWPWMDTPQMILVMTMRYWENEVWGVKRILGREIFRQTHVRKVFLLLVIIWRHVWSWRW